MTRRDLRLGSGLILFTYVAAHLANHALGLISVAAAQQGLRVAVAVWHSLPGTVLLYGAAGVHIGLAFIALYERRTLRMPPEVSLPMPMQAKMESAIVQLVMWTSSVVCSRAYASLPRPDLSEMQSSPVETSFSSTCAVSECWGQAR